MKWPTAGSVEERQLILAIFHVTGSTWAADWQGDRSFYSVLEHYYALVTDQCRVLHGHAVKYMGDAALLVFPPEHPRAAIDVVSAIQRLGTAMWQEFDDQCHVQAKVGLGTVLVGTLAGRPDVIGRALNALVKAPWDGDVHIDDGLARLAHEN